MRLKSFLRLLSLFSALGWLPGIAPIGPDAQGPGAAALAGTVTDGTGAVVTDAEVVLSPAGTGTGTLHRTTDATGSFTFQVSPGHYTLLVQAPGFAPYTAKSLALGASTRRTLAVRLLVAGRHDEINVIAEQDEAELGSEGTADSLLFSEDTLKLLSDDADTLQHQLAALAGGFGSPNFLVNGFSTQRLPPKSTIRSIRINRNSFSAVYPDFGLGRVEVDTAPGSDTFHGSLHLSGTDHALDAANPYAPIYPPFYQFEQDGSLSGPLGPKTSFLVSELTEQLANSAIVNAADPANPNVLVSTAVPAPRFTQNYTLRLDRQISRNNFAFGRNEWNEVHTRNNGILPLVLPEAAFASNLLTNTLQLADTQMIAAHALNETRFQYTRTRLAQQPNSTLPSVLVQGSFESGGSPLQALQDNVDAYELQNRFELERGVHLFRAGFNLRVLREANTSTAGFNGQYIFPDVVSYLAAQPSQYSETVGQPSATLVSADFGVYAEDSWKLTPNLTLNYGFRFERQTAIPGGIDPAPRLAVAWAVRPAHHKTPLLTLRAGYGLFYTRFPAAQLLTAVRQNGIREVAYVAQNPVFNPLGTPPGLTPAQGQSAVFQVDPSFHSQYMQLTSLSASRGLGHMGNLSANFIYAHDAHLYLTRNSNAPLPGTITTAVPAGVRPAPALGDIYQFASAGNGNQEQLLINYHAQLGSPVSVFGTFAAAKANTESDGAAHFTANPYAIRLDYGRSAIVRRFRYTGGFQWTLPYGLQLTPYLAANSGAPFDITTGTDLNGDTLFNDRPAFATDLTRSSVVRTAYGAFDVAPAVGERQIPRNYGTSPPLLWLQLQAGKDLHLGTRPTAAAASTNQSPPERSWVLHLEVEALNLINHNNPGLPVGALAATPCGSPACSLQPSPYFGHSLTLADDYSSNSSSNRTILLQVMLNW